MANLPGSVFEGGDQHESVRFNSPLGLVVAFAAPSFAAAKPPHTKAACEKAHMTWDAATKKCS